MLEPKKNADVHRAKATSRRRKNLLQHVVAADVGVVLHLAKRCVNRAPLLLTAKQVYLAIQPQATLSIN